MNYLYTLSGDNIPFSKKDTSSIILDDLMGGASSIVGTNESILKTQPNDAEYELNLDTEGGNASLVYLYSKIDRGIQIRFR